MLFFERHNFPDVFPVEMIYCDFWHREMTLNSYLERSMPECVETVYPLKVFFIGPLRTFTWNIGKPCFSWSSPIGRWMDQSEIFTKFSSDNILFQLMIRDGTLFLPYRVLLRISTLRVLYSVLSCFFFFFFERNCFWSSDHSLPFTY